MLRKAVAALLFLLTASPFTAPFATCDMTTLLGGHTPIAEHQASLSSTLEDHSQTIALCPTSRRMRMRTKFPSQTDAEARVESSGAPYMYVSPSSPATPRDAFGRIWLTTTALRI